MTIYSSFPLQGASRPIGEGSQQGIELAFKEHDYKAGDTTINFVPLDDSTAQAGAWTPEAESANARKAISDDAVALPRHLQLGRRGDLDPAPERGRDPAS